MFRFRRPCREQLNGYEGTAAGKGNPLPRLRQTLLTGLNVDRSDKDEPLDFRSQVIQKYMRDGRLLSWPSRFKRQYFVIEEISRRFEPGVEYSEREVDAILKAIYPTDHCTLRRYLVDLRFIYRSRGIYRR